MLITIIFAILGIFFILVSLPFTFWVYMTIKTVVDSRLWKPIQGKITTSHLVRNKDCNGLPGYHYMIAFEYEFNGQEYIGDEVRIGGFRYFSKARAQKMLEKYPVGKTVTVFYDPDYPDCSVLEQGFSLECIYPISIFSIIFSLGIILLVLMLIRLFG